MAKLTRVDVPAFMFLIDKIEDKIENEEENVDNKFQFISEKNYDDARLKASERTIRRVFELYESLYVDKPIKKHYAKPKTNTLDLLTSFYYGDRENLILKSFKFANLKRRHKEDINDYYANNKPTEEILDIIFEETPQKLKSLEDYEDELIAIAEELKNSTLKDFIKNWSAESLTNINLNIDHDRMKLELIDYIELRLKQTGKKRERVSFLYKIFGGFVLFFVSTPQYDDLKEYLIHTFISEHVDLEVDDDDDDFDDDD